MPPGAAPALRPSVHPRPWVRPALWDDEVGGVSPRDPYVLRFWTVAIGPGAVADLLRLISAARQKRRLRRPVYLQVLVREGLVQGDGRRLLVRELVPHLPTRLVHRLPPRLRREHQSAVESAQSK